jgi:hypothetical protein
MKLSKHHSRTQTLMSRLFSMLAILLLLTVGLGPIGPVQASGHHAAMNHQDMTTCSAQCVSPSRRDGSETNTLTAKTSSKSKYKVACAGCVNHNPEEEMYAGCLKPEVVRTDKVPIFLQAYAFLS